MEQPGARYDLQLRPAPTIGPGWRALGAAVVEGWRVRPPPWADLSPAGDGLPTEARPTLVLGIGGSALGARALGAAARRSGAAQAELRVLDTLDVGVVSEHLAWARAVGARAIVVSKSGTTVEIERLVEVFAPALGGEWIVVGDPGADGLARQLARAGRAPRFVEMPAAVGGRFSLLTAVGQVPLASIGLEPGPLLAAARAERDRLLDPEGTAWVGSLLAPALWRLRAAGRSVVLWSYDEALVPWCGWLQQLECESLGRDRDGVGVGELITILRGPADQHSVAQLLLDGKLATRVVFVDRGAGPPSDPGLARLDALREIEREATRDALDLPTARLLVGRVDAPSVAALCVRAMFELELIASVWGVDPYGQPGVQRIKRRVGERA